MPKPLDSNSNILRILGLIITIIIAVLGAVLTMNYNLHQKQVDRMEYRIKALEDWKDGCTDVSARQDERLKTIEKEIFGRGADK